MRKLRGGKGFTLVELLLVVIIVGILVGVAVPIYIGQQKKAKATEARNFVSGVLKGAQLYLQENGKFPVLTNMTYLTTINTTFSIALDEMNYFDWVVNSTYSSLTACAWGKPNTDVEPITISAWINIYGKQDIIESGL